VLDGNDCHASSLLVKSCKQEFWTSLSTSMMDFNLTLPTSHKTRLFYQYHLPFTSPKKILQYLLKNEWPPPGTDLTISSGGTDLAAHVGGHQSKIGAAKSQGSAAAGGV
jgi:hypothetical protein